MIVNTLHTDGNTDDDDDDDDDDNDDDDDDDDDNNNNNNNNNKGMKQKITQTRWMVTKWIQML